jgi:hypothetical protein
VVQIVVLDKLDYCATLNNLSEVADSPNFKVGVTLQIALVEASNEKYLDALLACTAGSFKADPLTPDACAIGVTVHQGRHSKRGSSQLHSYN